MTFAEIDQKDLKNRLDFDPLLPRIKAKKKVGAALQGKKTIIKG